MSVVEVGFFKISKICLEIDRISSVGLSVSGKKEHIRSSWKMMVAFRLPKLRIVDIRFLLNSKGMLKSSCIRDSIESNNTHVILYGGSGENERGKTRN